MNGLADLLGALAAAYPNPAPTPERMRAYMLALSDLARLPAERYVTAFRDITATDCEFYPSPGAVRRALDPGPTSAEIAELYSRIEGTVMAARSRDRGRILDVIQERYSAQARHAFIAAGGVEGVWQMEQGRAFRLRDFEASYREELTSPRALLGTMDDRVRELVSTTAQRFAADTPRLPGSR